MNLDKKNKRKADSPNIFDKKDDTIKMSKTESNTDMALNSAPEEGEIVDDDLEFIMSSEEDYVRRRIEELEADNAELEQIANISTNNGYHSTDRYTDFLKATKINQRTFGRTRSRRTSTASSTELPSTSKKRRKRRRKKARSPSNHRIEFEETYSKHSAAKHRQKHKVRHTTNKQAHSSESPELRPSLELHRVCNQTREELSIALASGNRSAPPSLKERLKIDKASEKENNSKNEAPTKKHKPEIDPVIFIQDSSSDSELLESQLRLDALKSAFKNSHKARRRRAEELPYSPTDFDKIPANELTEKHPIEMEYLENSLMDISPVASPCQRISPLDNEEQTQSTFDAEGANSHRPVDMDIADSNSEDCAISYTNESSNWAPIERMPVISAVLNYEENIRPMPLHLSFNESTGFALNFLSQTDACQKTVYSQNTQEQLVSVVEESEHNRENETLCNEVDSGSVNGNLQDLPNSRSMSISSDGDEEEEALRALLLSQFTTAKSAKVKVEEEPTKPTSKSPFEMPLLSATIDQNILSGITQPNQSLLKLAANRFRNNSTMTGNAGEIHVQAQDEEQNRFECAPRKDNLAVESNSVPSPNFIFGKEVEGLTSQREKHTNTRNNSEEIGKNTTSFQRIIVRSVEEINKSVDANKENERLLGSQNRPKIHAKVTSPIVDSLSSCKNASEKKIIAQTKRKRESPHTALRDNHSICLSNTNEIHINENEKNKELEARLENIPMPIEVQKKVVVATVKPNNNQHAAEQNVNSNTDITSSSATQITLSSPKEQTSSRTVTQRILTKADIDNIKVKKLVITVGGGSDTDSSVCSDRLNYENEAAARDTYSDIASPMSLIMDNSLDTVNRTDPPAITATGSNRESPTGNGKQSLLVNEQFEKQVESFLKSARVRTEVNPAAKNKNITVSDKITTPLAVRRLPQASQDEYRRLIYRMKLLEMRKVGKITKATSDTSSKTSSSTPLAASTNKTTTIKKPPSVKDVTSAKGTVAVKPSNKTAAADTNALPDATATATKLKTATEHQAEKNNIELIKKKVILSTCETSFTKLGSFISSGLDKSLELVKKAHEIKTDKVRLSNRIKLLRKELAKAESDLRTQQDLFSNALPSISAANSYITDLKSQYTSLLQKTTELGQEIEGPDYRVNNEMQKQINQKTSKLAAEIKLVNSMRVGLKVKIPNSREQPPQKKPVEKTQTAVSRTIKEVTLPQKTSEQVSNADVESINVTEGQSKDKVDKEVESSKEEESKGISETEQTISNKPNSKQSVITKKAPEIPDSNNAGATTEKNVEITSKRTLSQEATATLQGSLSIAQLKQASIEYRATDPNAVLCPFDLCGTCEDEQCLFAHLQPIDDAH